MTRRLILSCFILAAFLKANVDPLAARNLQSPANEFFGDAELITGQGLSESKESVLPFLLEVDPAGVDKFDLSETISEDKQSDGPVFLLSVIGLPRPAEAEMSLVQSSASYIPRQDPLNMWLLLGAVSMAIAFIGGIRVLRVWLTSANRA